MDDERSKRTEDEIKELMITFQERIHNNQKISARVKYFWPSKSAVDTVISALARGSNRLDDPLQDAGDSDDEEEHGRPKALRRKRNPHNRSFCVEWNGLLSKGEGYAAVKLQIPETFEPWVTYANRLVVFLFADIGSFESVDDFYRHTSAIEDEPFEMLCGNNK
eukprot:GHVU01192891.1.p1 GENE.GHVU01192891.1~~GHVU01192891.1.p1  ORF type:complete len:174 (-),score=31.19 GHVU01192891.1:1640-2131(-)